MGLNSENVTAAMMTGKPWLCLDIETCPMPNCGEYLTDPIEAPANYKDAEKIATFIEEKRAKQIANAGLDLDLCEVVAIGMKQPHTQAEGVTRADYPERELLRWFWDFVDPSVTLVGFNCLLFDLPILLRRSLYLGIPTPKLSLDKYRHDGIVDVQDALTYGGRMTWRSLAFYAKRFGIPHDDSVQGEDIGRLVTEGKWADIAAHARADVATTAALAQRIGLIHQPQQALIDVAVA